MFFFNIQTGRYFKLFQTLVLLKNLWIHDKMNIYYASQMEKRAVIFGARKKSTLEASHDVEQILCHIC